MVHFLSRLSATRAAFPAIPKKRASAPLSVSRLTPVRQPSTLLSPSCRYLSDRWNGARHFHEYKYVGTANPPSPPKRRSKLPLYLLYGVLAVASGWVGTRASIMKELLDATSFEEDESKEYTPSDDVSREIEEHIINHRITQALRGDQLYTESRPHLKMPEFHRPRSLTAGTLAGTDKIVVPPYVWNEEGGKSLVSIFYLGSSLTGHPGIVHGGMLATLLDEGLARCCFPALPNKIGVTANLNINYRSPAQAGSFFVLKAVTTKVEGRKAWVEGTIETLPEEGETAVVVADAKGLFIEPKHASLLSVTRS